MKRLPQPIRFLYLAHAGITFLVLMLLVIPLVLVASFFGKIKGGNFIYRVCCIWADVWFLLIGIRHINLYEVPHDAKRQYIFVANHISYLDAPIIVKTIRQRVRILGKAEMARIPLFGFIYRNTVVMVDRSNAANRASSVRILKSVIRRGISIILFPEGTFNESTSPVKDFYDGAFRIAIETQTPIKPVLFLDAFERLHYSSIFMLHPGLSRSVYLQEIDVTGMTTADLPRLKQQVYDLMDEKLRSYDAKWIR